MNGQPVDLQPGVVVAVDEGVADIDGACGDIAEDLLAVAELAGGEGLDAEAHVGGFEVRLDLIECLRAEVIDRVLTRDLEAYLIGAGLRREDAGAQGHCRHHGSNRLCSFMISSIVCSCRRTARAFHTYREVLPD